MLLRSCLLNRSSQIFTVAGVIRSYAAPKNFNGPIVDMLRKHRENEYNKPNRNGYKVRAFDNAIKAISQLDRPLQSLGEAKIKGIGTGISRKINEFLAEHKGTQDSSNQDVWQEHLKAIARQELEEIPGVGVGKARKLVEAGCLGTADLRKGKYIELLSDIQKLGLKYLDHVKPISREEAETVAQFIRDNISSKYEVIITGSYRRGLATSNDIDIIILHPNHVYVPVPEISPDKLEAHASLRKQAEKRTSAAMKNASPLISDVIPVLTERGLFADSLSTSHRRWYGVVRVPEKNEEGRWLPRGGRLSGIKNTTGVFRRLDLNLIPMKSRGAGLIASTGDTTMNKDLRMRAIKLGMHLNEFGLWRWNLNSIQNAELAEDGDSGTRTQGGFWQLMKAQTEQDIFDQLDMEYIEPHRRNLSFLYKT